MKKRLWNENIGKLIVFAITIIIWIWVVSIYSYFFNVSSEQAVVQSILNSPSSTPDELFQAWLCASPAEGSEVEVDALQNLVFLTCPSGFGPNA